MGAGKKIAIYTILLTSFVCNFLYILVIPVLVKYTKSCNCLNSCILKDISFDPTKDESKWSFLRAVGLRLATFLFIHTAAVMSLRIFTQKSSPATQDDPTTIKLLNRIVTNTLEHSFIFLLLLAYFIFDGPGKFILT